MQTPDLLIVGGGAAGLSAAGVGRKLGLSVELIDERPALGGNYYAGVGGGGLGSKSDRQHGSQLLTGAARASLSEGAFAWRVERNGRTFVVTDSSGVGVIAPKRLLIATGAMERPVPIPGSTLPGVMYAGAAQLVLKTSAMVPAGRCVLVGSGPLLLLLATQLVAAGASPAAIIETTPARSAVSLATLLRSASSAPDLLLRGLAMMIRLKLARIPWHHHATNIGVLGEGRADRVEFIDGHGRGQSVAADLVLVHDGIVPNDHVTRQLGCAEIWHEGQHSFHPQVDGWGETSISGIFAAGDCTGIWGAKAAEMAGQLAALQIAHQLGRIDQTERDRRARHPLKRLERQRRFRPFLEHSFPPTMSQAATAKADTIVCRCENVTAGEIRLAVAQGATGPDQLKSFTRCGMGPCQGRGCSLAAAEIISHELGTAIASVGRHDIRAPLKPIPLGKIATAALEAEPTR